MGRGQLCLSMRTETRGFAILLPSLPSHLFLPVLAGTMRKVRDSQEMLLPDGEVSWSLCQQMLCLDMYWLLSQILSLNLVFSSEILCRLFHQFELEPSLGLSVLIYGVRKIRILAPSQICWVHSFFFFSIPRANFSLMIIFSATFIIDSIPDVLLLPGKPVSLC